MCELFGISSPEKISCNEMLREFFSHGNEHPHGWGLALISENTVSVEKQPSSSVKSEYLRERLRNEILSDKLLAHIRYATKGTQDYWNTHPFVLQDAGGRSWTLEHNGTIFESPVLDPFVKTQTGQTDSERILCCLVSRMNQTGKRIPAKKRCSIAEELLREITPENKVNLLIHDGDLLYVHMNYPHSLYQRRKGSAVIISSRPLDCCEWTELPLNTLVVYKNGKLFYTGTPHGNTFTDSEEKQRLLYLDYAFL